jgi:hypothetical protein
MQVVPGSYQNNEAVSNQLADVGRKGGQLICCCLSVGWALHHKCA